MKGFRDKNNKFHPIRDNKKLKHKSNNSEGVKIKRKAKPSTQFSGMLLFDVANKVGNWEGDVTTRGMFDRWIHKKTGEELILEINEDTYNPEKETWYYDLFITNPKTGYINVIYAGDYDTALKIADEWMRKNQ